MRIFAAALFLPLLAFAQADWRFAHPDATLVGSLRPSAVLDSPLFAPAIQEAKKQDPSAAMMADMAKGILSGISEIRFSVLDNGTPEVDVLALITGSFDESLAAMLGQANAKHVRVDDHTFLFGNGPSLDKAAARIQQSTPLLQPRALAGTQSLAGYDLWVSGKLPDLATKGLKLDLRGLALGLSIHDNVELELAMEATSPKAAQALLKTAHDGEASVPPQYKGLLQSFVDGNSAHFRLNISRELALEAMRQGATPALAASNTPQPLPAPAKPRRNTIIIQGLDDGPLEIPLH